MYAAPKRAKEQVNRCKLQCLQVHTKLYATLFQLFNRPRHVCY